MPANATRYLKIQANPGSIVYFILPQLEEGPVCTSSIPGGTGAITRTTSASDTSGNGLQCDLTQRMIDVFTGELVSWPTAWKTVNGAPSYSADNKTLTYTGALTASDYHALSATIAAGKQIEVSYTISSYSEGSFKLGFGSGATGVDRTADGTYTERGILTTTTNLYALSTAFTGVVKFNYVRRVLEDGSTNPGEGTLLQVVELPFGGSDMTTSGANSIVNAVNPNNATFTGGLMIQRGSTLQYPVRLSEGASYANLTGTIQSGRYVLIGQWSSVTGQMRAGLYNPATGALTWSSPTLAGATPIAASSRSTPATNSAGFTAGHFP